jgi:ABC-type oligopeptide transport system ATPase subunit
VGDIMNFIDTLKSVDLVLVTGEVPLIVGETGIGKTALAKEIATINNWSLMVIDGNLLKEGEIGGLPTIESYTRVNHKGNKVEKKTTVYAVHNKLREIDEEISKGKTVLLFIDEINRCEHTVQQELMNLILNREINGYKLHEDVKIVAAMNPSNKYGSDFDYQVVDMDVAQENRFVWLHMEPDYMQWLDWAIDAGIEQKVIEFISTFPEYLHKTKVDDIRATPRSYERISSIYKIYKERKDSIPRSVFLNVIKGNVGKLIAEEFISFVESDYSPLLSYEDVFSGDSLPASVIEKVKSESHTRLYLSAKNILKNLEANINNGDYDTGYYIDRLIEFLKIYPVDLMIGIMKDIKNSYAEVYKLALENEAFVESYFESYNLVR